MAACDTPRPLAGCLFWLHAAFLGYAERCFGDGKGFFGDGEGGGQALDPFKKHLAFPAITSEVSSEHAPIGSAQPPTDF